MDPRVTELHCIMPIGNVASVLRHGILSHERASRLVHRSVAMEAVQDKRSRKVVPGGQRLHRYANLYFHARNPMLSARRHEDVCVLRISVSVLEWKTSWSEPTKKAAVASAIRNLAAMGWIRVRPSASFLVD